MEIFKALTFISIIANILLCNCLVKGQSSTPCTASMINNFTPCFNVITGSSSNGSSAQKDNCCNTLRSLSGISMDCVCLLLTANVPIPLPINSALALIVPSSCNLTDLPSQCKASGSPLASPGPISNSIEPTPSPAIAASPFSPQVSKAVAEALVLELTSTYPPVESQAPTTHPRIRPVLVPASGSNPFSFCPPPLLLILLFVVIMCFKSH